MVSVSQYTTVCFNGVNVDLHARMKRKSRLCVLIYVNMIKLGYRLGEDFYKFVFMIQKKAFEFFDALVISHF